MIAGFDLGSLVAFPQGQADAVEVTEACFLVSSTAVGAAYSTLEQIALDAALWVYETDPFPEEPLDWSSLLNGTLGAFLRPRPMYFLSYFVSVQKKRWAERMRHCHALAWVARALRGLYFDPAALPDDEAGCTLDATSAALWRAVFGRSTFSEIRRGRAQLVEAGVSAWEIIEVATQASGTTPAGLARRHAAWRCLAAGDPKDPAGPHPAVLWRATRAALEDGRVELPGPVPPRDQSVATVEWLSAVDEALQRVTPLPARPPAVSVYWPYEARSDTPTGPVLPSTFGQLRAVRDEVQKTLWPLLTARFGASPASAYCALTPLAAVTSRGVVPGPWLAAQPDFDPVIFLRQLWRYAWALRLFRNDGAPLARLKAAWVSAGEPVPSELPERLSAAESKEST